MLRKALKIAIYSGEIPSATFIERLIKGVAATGTEVVLFGAIKQQPAYGPQVKVVGYKQNRLSKAWQLLRFTLLLALFRQQDKKRLDTYLKHQRTTDLYTKVKYYPVLWYQPDIFHIQWAKSLKDWMWVQDFGIKLVLSLRGAHINYSPIADKGLADIYRQNFPKVNRFHAVSKAIALEAYKYGADRAAIRVVKSGLDLEKSMFKSKDFDSKTPLNILSVGRDHWIKNYRLALDAMFLLKQMGTPFHYNIIGITENEALLFQRAQLELVNEITFVDTMPFEKVQEAIRKANVLLLPSLKEGIANVVLEAMAIGTLVISNDCGGMAEVVISGQTGILVPIRDPQAMAMALKDMSELSLEAYQELTKQARTFVEVHHSEKQMVNGMLELYRDVISVE